MDIYGYPGYFKLTTAEGEYISDSPDELLNHHLGWDLPLASLPFWIRGLPAPDVVTDIDFNQQQAITQLEQAGWTISYMKYNYSNNLYLPAKMIMLHPLIKLTLINKNWQLNKAL